jgi:hypothetical protein
MLPVKIAGLPRVPQQKSIEVGKTDYPGRSTFKFQLNCDRIADACTRFCTLHWQLEVLRLCLVKSNRTLDSYL